MKHTVAAYDIVKNETVSVEIDPEIPFYSRHVEGKPPERVPMMEGFSKEGQPILRFGYLAHEFEVASLEAFKSAFRKG